MKISASIYSYRKEKGLEQLVKDLDADAIDMLHVDCADDDKAFDDIRRIRQVSKTPIDLHIISSEPEKYFSHIENLEIEFVSFQYENLKEFPVLPKGLNTKFGLSIVSSTPIDVFEQVEASYDFVVMMSTTPGKSGGEFNRESFQRIISFQHRFPKKKIHADGGVNDQIAYILRMLGVNAVVSGSYLVNHESLTSGMLSFHQPPKESHRNFQVQEFMTGTKYLPVLYEEHLDFKTILQAIEDYKLGFALIVNNDGKLSGVVSNADIRRGLLSSTSDFNAVNLKEVINRNPIAIREDTTVSGIVRLLNDLNFIVLFLPVVNENGQLKGTVLLNNLIRV
ncbi:MAG: CBS domain-containing protein [Bacteroidetes bacterium]|nr:CBS domain-containing protein [Bacteroidota bacterium]